jgi:hypothetical protein
MTRPMPSFSHIIFLIHRYLGIGVGIVVALWCISGFVMMYVPFPSVTKQEALFASPHISFRNCCVLPGEDEFAPIELNQARISYWPFRPVLFLNARGGGQYPIDMNTGAFIQEITPGFARTVVRQYANQVGAGTLLQFEGLIERDQWTVTGYFDDSRPFYKYRILDGKGTRLYVSAVTGEVVQQTERWERFWNWGGAIIHWIYPSFIRQHTTVWYWTVVWLTIVGLFLTVTGLYIALRYFQFRSKGQKSPFQGVGLWHHYLGLFFGILTLTWLFSGLLSMNPWGLLEGRSTAFERAVVKGGQLTFSTEMRDMLEGLGEADLGGDVVWIEIVQVDGQLAAILYNKSGEAVRYNPATWLPEALNDLYFESMARRIKPETPLREADWIDQEDAYYYGLKEPVRLPVYRVLYEDGERAYFDSVSGELVRLVDQNRKWYRWLFNGLHSIDFVSGIRQRPVWDILVWLLLGGVTAGAVTGTWLGWLRITGRREYVNKELS